MATVATPPDVGTETCRTLQSAVGLDLLVLGAIRPRSGPDCFATSTTPSSRAPTARMRSACSRSAFADTEPSTRASTIELSTAIDRESSQTSSGGPITTTWSNSVAADSITVRNRCAMSSGTFASP